MMFEFLKIYDIDYLLIQKRENLELTFWCVVK